MPGMLYKLPTKLCETWSTKGSKQPMYRSTERRLVSQLNTLSSRSYLWGKYSKTKLHYFLPRNIASNEMLSLQSLSKEFCLGSENEVVKHSDAHLKHTLWRNISADHYWNPGKTLLTDLEERAPHSWWCCVAPMQCAFCKLGVMIYLAVYLTETPAWVPCSCTLAAFTFCTIQGSVV